MYSVCVVLEPAISGVYLLVNAFGHAAETLAKDADEERPGLFDMLEADVQCLVIGGSPSGSTRFSLRNPHSQFRNRKALKRRSMSTDEYRGRKSSRKLKKTKHTMWSNSNHTFN